MAADWMWLASRDERWFACGGHSITLCCARSDDEAVVDGRLDVHGYCCFLIVMLF